MLQIQPNLIPLLTDRRRIGDALHGQRAELERLGARGVVKPSANSVQVIVGPIADQLAGEIQDTLSISDGMRV